MSNAMMFPEPHFVETNGIRMAVYEQGSGPAIVLLHGFPELAYSWRHQIPALAAAGFRVIAPDQRGYGRTTVPAKVEDYCVAELIRDIHGLLDALQLETATFVGHDWGALLLWQMAMLAPARIDKLINLNIPHFPRTPIDPIEVARSRLGDNFYIVNFQDSDEADRTFESNPAHVFDRLMRKNRLTREQFDLLPAAQKVPSLIEMTSRATPSGEPLLSDAERGVFAKAFQRSGFTGPINWYRNWTRNWQALEGVDELISIPTLFIGADNDVIISPENIEAMKPLVSDLTIHMLRNCGHWSQQEQPEAVNRTIIDWLVQRR